MESKAQYSLHEAVRKGDIDSIRSTLNAGANVNEKEKNGKGNTPLYIATRIGTIEIMKLLLEAGAGVRIKNNKNWTPLQGAIDQPDVEKAKILIDPGADSSEKVGKFGRAALHLAVEQNNVEVVKHILSCMDDVNIRCNFFRQTPLHKATNSNKGDSHIHVIEALLKNKKVKINAQDIEEKTPLHYLVRPWEVKVNVNVVELFLKYKPDLYIKDQSGEIPLVLAVQKSQNSEVVQALIDHGSDVNWVNTNSGFTLMHYACSENVDTEIIECLLKNGANINALDSEGCPPIARVFQYYYIVDSQKCRTLKFLLKHGADVNIIWKYFDNLAKIRVDFQKSNEEYIYDKNILTIEYLKEVFWKIILQHIAKLLLIGCHVHPKILQTISNSKDYKSYFDQCTNELILAKNTKINDSSVTFYNILVEDKKKLENYFTENQDLLKDFEKSQYKKQFPIYETSMKENVVDVIKKHTAVDNPEVLI